MTTMMQQRPDSPPTNELPYGLEQLAHHNANSPFLAGTRNEGESFYDDSPFGSPSMMQQSNASPNEHQYMHMNFDDSQYPELHEPRATGLGIQFPGFSTPDSGLYPASGEYYPAQQVFRQS